MPLKITRSIDPIEVKRIITNLYSPPGLGKTTLACTAEKPLLFDFDEGSHRAKNRPDTVRVERWEDVVGMTAADFAPYKTAIIDTAGRALDVLTPAILRMDPKFGRKSGALSLQGFGELRSTFLGWLNLLKSFGLDVITVCHSDEQKRGDEMVERLDVQGGSKQEIYKSADQMGRLYLENGKRILNFDPTDVAFGKNPGELPPLDVPDYRMVPDFMAQILVRVKAKLNELTATQAAAAGAQAEWKARFEAAATADDFTALMDPVRTADESIRASIRPLLVQVAKSKGFQVAADKTKFESIPGLTPAPAVTESSAAGSAATETSQDDKGDAPTVAELASEAAQAAAGQSELPATKKTRGKAA